MQRTRRQLAEILDDSELVYSAEQVTAAFDRMAAQINDGLTPLLAEAGDLLMLPVLKGGMYPAVELMSRLAFPFTLDYLHATRYEGIEGGELGWRAEPFTSLEDRAVLIVDDIFDQGATLQAIVDYCREAGAARVFSVAFLLKRHGRYTTQYRPDFVGLEVEDRYVFGCGMDFEEYFRGLPEVRALGEAWAASV